jgi:hypothetical protein
MPLEKNMASFEIEFANLWTYEGGSSDERLPLNRLSENGGHIHGLLQIKVNGTVLPRNGFFGPDDVCFNEWVFELSSALRELRGSTSASYTYDEGEQGQSAFLFERVGDVAFASIVASQLSDADADPEWQRVQFSFRDFERSVEDFLSRLRNHIETESSEFGESWWAQVAERAA